MLREKPNVSNWRSRLGWWLVIGSVPVWCGVFIAPFLPVSVVGRAAIATGSVVAGELMFWAGLLVLGPSIAAKLRTPKVNTGRSFAGRRVAVVGAAGGLGGVVVEALRREGAEVLALGRSLERLRTRHPDPTIAVQTLDLEQPLSIGVAVQSLAELDAVVVATGVDVRKPLTQHDDTDIDRQLSVNLRGPMCLTRELLPKMEPSGVIAFLGGFGDGRMALPYYSADVASRAGLAAFCESMNRELALEGMDITVSYLCPEPADTLAERPYSALWTRMGNPPVSAEKVADFVLQSLLSHRKTAVMGCKIWFAAKLNAVSSVAANLAGLSAAGVLLRDAFGSSTRGTH
jgi:NAD(P)-dependent dehydrogenase (short-subunit alcohol dehydrogenase family)